MTRAAEDTIFMMIQTYGAQTGWARIGEIAESIEATPAEIKEAIETLIGDEDFRGIQEPLSSRNTPADRKYAPVINGEPIHLIKWS